MKDFSSVKNKTFPPNLRERQYVFTTILYVHDLKYDDTLTTAIYDVKGDMKGFLENPDFFFICRDDIQ